MQIPSSTHPCVQWYADYVCALAQSIHSLGLEIGNPDNTNNSGQKISSNGIKILYNCKNEIRITIIIVHLIFNKYFEKIGNKIKFFK